MVMATNHYDCMALEPLPLTFAVRVKFFIATFPKDQVLPFGANPLMPPVRIKFSSHETPVPASHQVVWAIQDQIHAQNLDFVARDALWDKIFGSVENDRRQISPSEWEVDVVDNVEDAPSGDGYEWVCMVLESPYFANSQDSFREFHEVFDSVTSHFLTYISPDCGGPEILVGDSMEYCSFSENTLLNLGALLFAAEGLLSRLHVQDKSLDGGTRPDRSIREGSLLAKGYRGATIEKGMELDDQEEKMRCTEGKGIVQQESGQPVPPVSLDNEPPIEGLSSSKRMSRDDMVKVTDALNNPRPRVANVSIVENLEILAAKMELNNSVDALEYVTRWADDVAVQTNQDKQKLMVKFRNAPAKEVGQDGDTLEPRPRSLPNQSGHWGQEIRKEKQVGGDAEARRKTRDLEKGLGWWRELNPTPRNWVKIKKQEAADKTSTDDRPPQQAQFAVPLPLIELFSELAVQDEGINSNTTAVPARPHANADPFFGGLSGIMDDPVADPGPETPQVSISDLPWPADVTPLPCGKTPPVLIWKASRYTRWRSTPEPSSADYAPKTWDLAHPRSRSFSFSSSDNSVPSGLFGCEQPRTPEHKSTTKNWDKAMEELDAMLKSSLRPALRDPSPINHPPMAMKHHSPPTIWEAVANLRSCSNIRTLGTLLSSAGRQRLNYDFSAYAGDSSSPKEGYVGPRRVHHTTKGSPSGRSRDAPEYPANNGMIAFREARPTYDTVWIMTWAKICVGIVDACRSAGPVPMAYVLGKLDRLDRTQREGKEGEYGVWDLLVDLELYDEVVMMRVLLQNKGIEIK